MLKHENRASAVQALKLLIEADMFTSDLYAKVLEHEKDAALIADILARLKEKKMDTAGNFSLILNHEQPCSANMTILVLYDYDILTDEHRDQILKQKNAGVIYCIFRHMGETQLCTRDNLCAVINYPGDSTTLSSWIKDLYESVKLNQASFNNCLAKADFATSA